MQPGDQPAEPEQIAEMPHRSSPALALVAAFGLLLLGIGLSQAAEQTSYQRGDGQRIDARVLAVSGGACAPLAIISHGLGGTSRGNAGLAATLNRAGFRVVLPSHPESGPRLLGEVLTSGRPRVTLIERAADRELLQRRLEDISAILAVETRRCVVPFKLLAGHSMGSRTALIEAGAGNSAGLRGKDRFDAYIAVSPAGEGSRLFPNGAMASIRKPVLMITGTEDRAEGGGYESRLSAFDGLAPGRKRMAVLDGANHMQLGRDGAVGQQVGALASEFVAQLRAGRFGPATRRTGIQIAEK